MDTKRAILLSVLVAVLIGVLVELQLLREKSELALSPGLGHVRAPVLGVAFDYPSRYVLETHREGSGSQEWYVEVLTQGSSTPNSEGPPAITASVFPNLENVSLEAWVRADARSNFTLSNEVLASTTVGGEPALQYTHTGLYEADAVVVAHGGKIYLFEVGWLSLDDRIRKDFEELLKTVSFL